MSERLTASSAVCFVILAMASVQTAATDSIAAEPAAWVLCNDHLEVIFRNSDAGPRLTQIKDCVDGGMYRFEDAQTIALAIVSAESVDDPKLQVRYRMQDRFQFEPTATLSGPSRATFCFLSDSVQADVTYALQPDSAVLRKTVRCTARGKAIHVAGVSLWILKPSDSKLAWPKRGGYGQPAILLSDTGGCFITLEWPRMRVVSVDGRIQIGYRPGYSLKAGESREIAAGSIGIFPTDAKSDAEKLDVARHAFFDHVADRVKPRLPFPIKFTTWGPWLGQARADRILQVIDDLADVGVDLVHFDAGWQQPDHPYSQHFVRVRDADAETWDRAMTQPERLPEGLLPIVRAAKKRGMRVSLWFDACGNVFVREGTQWAIRDRRGEPVSNPMWEGRWGMLPRQSLASEYGDRLRAFALQTLDRYDLGGIMFDNNHYTSDFALGRRSLANGWDAIDVQLREILEVLDEAERRRPGIYRFLCVATPWPWALLHATHIHARDPGMSAVMLRATATDHPARALAYERRLAWQQQYDNFVPPWGIKGDIAGWSVQQQSPIPVNLRHTGQLIPTGEGWTQNMFMCFATTAVRDIRFSFAQMPTFDRQILKEWLDWDRQRTHFIFNCRPLFDPGDDPNQGIDGFSHVGNGQGVMYCFNHSFDLDEACVTLDERAGFCPQDRNLPAYLVYPVKAPLGSGTLSYGQELHLPLIGKDCAVIEVGLRPPRPLVSYADYTHAAHSVRRSFDTRFLTSASEVFRAAGRSPIRIEVGQSPRDRRLASQICETLGAAIGRRISLDDCSAVSVSDAACRFIVGTHEGLRDHPEIGKRFQETLYNRYINWDDTLVSAPLVTSLPRSQPPTLCLIAPRPEQLARLATNLTSTLLKRMKRVANAEITEPVARDFTWQIHVPPGRSALRFLPVVSQHGHVPVPGDLQMLRFQIAAECDGKQTVVWREEIPPFCSPWRSAKKDLLASAQWWRDRLVSIADFAGKSVSFHFSAEPIDGRGHPQITIGFSQASVVQSGGS